MKNSDKFILAFNSIESFLKDKQTQQHQPFFSLIEKGKKHHSVVRKFEQDLREFANLRNAIVHYKSYPEVAIAEPHQIIVDKIQFIEKELKKPQTVYPLFQRKVLHFQTDHRLTDLLLSIKKNQYSQFPIYNKETFVGLLNENGLTQWIVNNVQDDIVSLSETFLQEVMNVQEEHSNYEFISKTASIYEAIERFEKNRKLDALLISENGRSNEALLGIITAWDLFHTTK